MKLCPPQWDPEPHWVFHRVRYQNVYRIICVICENLMQSLHLWVQKVSILESFRSKWTVEVAKWFQTFGNYFKGWIILSKRIVALFWIFSIFYPMVLLHQHDQSPEISSFISIEHVQNNFPINHAKFIFFNIAHWFARLCFNIQQNYCVENVYVVTGHNETCIPGRITDKVVY